MKYDRRYLILDYSLVSLTIVIFVLLGTQKSIAQKPEIKSNETTVVDCTDAYVRYSDDPSLTRAEKLALMDQALMNSLSRYDACQTSRSHLSGGVRGGEVVPTGISGGLKSEENSTNEGSAASESISGTEKLPAVSARTPNFAPVEWSNPGKTTLSESQPSGSSGEVRASNGKIPEDIPTADNDSVLEAQIRQAALNETDPEVQDLLWDEYRKYKGLKRTH